MQKGYQRTLTVLSTIRNSLCRDGLADQGIYSKDCLLQHSTSSPHFFFHSYIQSVVRKNFLSDSLKVMLLCGSDLLESFSTPGIWIPDQVEILNFANKKNTFATFLQTYDDLFSFTLVFILYQPTLMPPTLVSSSELYAGTSVSYVYAGKEKMLATLQKLHLQVTALFLISCHLKKL